MNDDFDMVTGLLLHLGGLDKAPYEMKARVVESINPVMKEWGIWQAQDDVYGLSWIIALDNDSVRYLVGQRQDGVNWAEYPSVIKAAIAATHDKSKTTIATVTAFHDTRHGVSPPAFLQIGQHFVYRNISGHAVPIDSELAAELLEINKAE